MRRKRARTRAMRRVCVYAAMSLDGCIARRDGSVDWLPRRGAAGDGGYAEFFARVDTVLMGRKTYEWAIAFGEPSRLFEGRRMLVLSRKQAGRVDEHGAEFAGGDLRTFLRKLRRARGRDVWLVGGGEAVRACLEAGGVDEIILSVIPILLGDGLPLFPPSAPATELRLRESRAGAGGVVRVSYVVVRNGRARGGRS